MFIDWLPRALRPFGRRGKNLRPGVRFQSENRPAEVEHLERRALLTLSGPVTSAGVIAFGDPSYEVGDKVLLQIADSDLTALTFIDVDISTDSGDVETVRLTQAGTTGIFSGTIATRSADTNTVLASDNFLEVRRLTQASATYNDANNGTIATSVSASTRFFVNTNIASFDFSDSTGLASTDGFTSSGSANLWHLSTGRGFDFGHSTDDSFYFGTNENQAGGGAYTANSAGTLTSPQIDLTNYSGPIFLEFNHFLDTEDINDVASVNIVTASGTTTVASSAGSLNNLADQTGAFAAEKLNLSAFAGQKIQVQFSFSSNGSIQREGWYVDDVRISAPLVTVSGTVFNDVNGNGQFDPNELGSPGWTIFTDTNGNGVVDDNTNQFNNIAPLAISDDNQVNASTINVSNLANAIKDINVSLTITHPRDTDLDVFLVSPSGTRVELFTDIGGNAANFANTTLDNEAQNPITIGVAPFIGAFRPEGDLSKLYGENPNGVWRLEISDDTTANVGTLQSWTLTIKTGEFSTVSDANGNYTLPVLRGGTYNIREVQQVGVRQTLPISTSGYSITIPNGGAITQLNFGDQFIFPVVTLPSSPTVYNENAPAVTVDPRGTVTDANSANFNGGSLRVTITGNATVDDILQIQNQGSGTLQISTNGSNVLYGGVNIGTFTGGTNLAPLVVSFNANATPAAAQALIRAIQFSVTGENPSGLTRTIEFVVTDETGGASKPVTQQVAVLPSNDPPILNISPGVLNYNEDDGPKPVDPLATLTDPDSPDFNGGSVTVSIVGNDAGPITTDTTNYPSLDVPIGTTGPTSQQTIVNFDFEAPGGFSTDENFTSFGPANLWHLSNGLSSLTGHTATNDFAFSRSETTTAAGFTAVNADGSLLSAPIDLRNVQTPTTLTFNFWLDAMTTVFSFTQQKPVIVTHTAVEVAAVTPFGRFVLADSTAINLNAGLADTLGRWRQCTLDLRNFVGSTIQIEFRARDLNQTVDGNNILGQGWFVDDVQVQGAVAQPVSSTLLVTGATGKISDIDVHLDITHPADAELTAYLIAPDGTSVRLFQQPGNSIFGGGFGNANFTGTILDDEADIPIESVFATAPYTGRYQPEKSLSILDNKDPNGTWTLQIFDAANRFGNNTGTLNSWSLDISTETVSANEKLSIINQGFNAGELGVVGNRVTYGGTAFGIFSGGVGTTPLVINLSTQSSQAAVQSLIQNIAFQADGDNPIGGQRQINFVVDDGDGATTPPYSKTLVINPVNDVPEFDWPGGVVNYTEGSIPIPIDSLATITDVDSADFFGGVLTVTLTSPSGAVDKVTIRNTGTGTGQINQIGSTLRSGTIVIGTVAGGSNGVPLTATFNANATPDIVQKVVRNLSFQALGTNPNITPRSITAVVTDGDGGTSATNTKTITITDVNSPPTLTLPGTTATYLAAGGPVVIDSAAVVTDSDQLVLDGGVLTVTVVGNVTSRDRLTLQPQGFVTLFGANVSYAGVVVGTVTPGVGATPLTVTFNSSASITAVREVVRSIAFSILGPNPTGGTRSITFTLTDGRGGSSATLTKPVNVQIQNQAPVNTVPTTDYTTDEDTATYLTELQVSDADAFLLPIQVTLNVVHGTLTVATNVSGGVTSAQVTGNGTNEVIITGDQEAINATLASATGVRYLGTLDFSGQDRLAITTNDLGNSGPGGALSDTDQVFIDVNAVFDTARITTTSGITTSNRGAEVLIDPLATYSLGDTTGLVSYDGAILQVSITSGRNRSDRLRVRTEGTSASQINVVGTAVRLGRVLIGRVSGGENGVPLKVVFNANATTAIVQHVIRDITFRTATQTTVAGNRTLQFNFTDSSALASTPAIKTVNVIR